MSMGLYFDLIKAKRDISKLVKVQRVVSRGGKTFTQDFYVKPSQVLKTDKVIGNFQNVLPAPGSVPKPAKGVYDDKYFQSITQNKNDRTDALDYLGNDLGLTWKHSANKNIEWMWALNALNVFLGKKQPQITSNPTKVSTSSSQPTNAQPAQNTQTGTTAAPSTQTKSSTLKLPTDIWNALSNAQQEINSAANGRETVVVLKKTLNKVGKGKFLEFARSLKAQGNLDFVESGNDAIDNMRASMALSKFYDSQKGTTSPSTKDIKAAKGTGKGGAPVGNQNAATDDSVDDDIVVQPDPDPIPDPVDPDLLEIPDTATEREKNIISLINTISDETDLGMINKTGFVPEDDMAKAFIKDTLWEEYDRKVKSKPNQPGFKSSNSPYGNNPHSYYRNASRIGDGFLSEETSDMFRGVSKKVMKHAFSSAKNNLLSSENVMQMIHPRNTMTVSTDISARDSSNDTSMVKISTLMRGFSTYATADVDGDPVGMNSYGYDGLDLKKAEDFYDLDKEGMKLVLDHIATQNPELKDTCDEMIKDYDTMMKSSRCSMTLLSTCLTTRWDKFEKAIDSRRQLKEAYNTIVIDMKSKGFTDEEISNTMKKDDFSYYNNSVYVRSATDYWQNKLDSNGNKISYDYSSLVTPSGNTISDVLKLRSSFSFNGNYVGSFNKISSGTPNLLDNGITEDDYNNIVESAYKFARIKIADKTTMVQYTEKPSKWDSVVLNDMLTAPESKDENIDTIWSNLILTVKAQQFKGAINSRIWENPMSKANKNGDDYRGNFDYHIPDFPNSQYNRVKGYALRNTRYYPLPEDENNKVKSQVDNLITYSSEHMRKLNEYVQNESDASFKKNDWGDDYETQEQAKCASVSLLANQWDWSKPSPILDIFMDQLKDAAVYCPQNFNSRVKTIDKAMEKSYSNLGYKAYQFKTYAPVVAQASASPAAITRLRQLREDALKNAHCTLKRVNDTERNDVEHDIKINFDRIDPNTGKRVPKADRVYDNRTLVFHSGVYEVKNSKMQADFEEEAKKLGETPITSYHGTSYTGACGICGVDGTFRYRRQDMLPGQNYTGTMMGTGIYAAKQTGKCTAYIGSNSYSYSSYTVNDIHTPDNAADGVILVMDTVLGKHGEFNDSTTAERNNKNEGGTYDSVAMGAGALMSGGSKLKEYERVVTRPSMVAPRYIVDCGARRR